MNDKTLRQGPPSHSCLAFICTLSDAALKWLNTGVLPRPKPYNLGGSDHVGSSQLLRYCHRGNHFTC